MDSVSSRELKNKTGEVLRRVRRGERLAVTNRGRPVALLVPYGEAAERAEEGIRPFEAAWSDIEATLAASPPVFTDWQEATARSRRRR